MKSTTMLMRALGVAALVLLVGTSIALAHGTPTISADPATVAAGGKITLSGDGMGTDGQIVTISLKGMLFSAKLGTAKLSDDAYTSVTFTIPAKAAPGTYLIVAQNGADNASISIEVTASVVPRPVAQPTPKQAGLPTAVPTVKAEMTTPAPTVTQVANAGTVAADQTTVVTPGATTEPIAALLVAATPATAVMPVATGVPAVSSSTDSASAPSSPADQTIVDTTMPMAGVAPLLVRVRTPLEWASPIGFVVLAGGVGLFLLTRQLS